MENTEHGLQSQWNVLLIEFSLAHWLTSTTRGHTRVRLPELTNLLLWKKKNLPFKIVGSKKTSCLLQ
ncbi:hypothetical protein BLOT_002870 [Blomia tropicalis]|nr:hypothetical protein BLOT_002870 [Blomia tropicalis]